MSLSEVIKTALDKIQYIAKTETVIGEPIVAGDVTLVPVSKVSIGFAAGGAGKNESSTGAGTGGGINVTPVAFICIANGKVTVQPVEITDPGLQKILSLAPDLIKKVASFVNKKERGSTKEKDSQADRAVSGEE
ncbi:MAG: GerW family sporulation protein [Chitinivibrionales bacterium]